MKLIIIWFLLLLFWIFAIYSVSIHESFQITLKQQSAWIIWEPSNYFYFLRQLKNIVIWIFVWLIIYKIPLEFIKKYRNFIFLFFLFFLFLVFTPLWVEFNWSRWWLHFSWIWTIQPWEFFKLAFVIFLSWWLIKKKHIIWTFKWFFLFSIVCAIFFSIFLKIPDLWTILVLWLVVLIMFWYVWWSMKYILLFWTIWIILWFSIWMQFDYIKNRLDYFFNEQIDEVWKWIWWQIQQAIISIWAWWIFWNWYWKWLQKFWYIPEAQSDFIFAAFSEEVWFFWNLILIWLYFMLCYFFLINLNKISDEYNKILWIWIISLIIVQAFVNIWVNIKILPLTWLTLPFISYWWSALMINIIEIILMYKILYERKN